MALNEKGYHRPTYNEIVAEYEQIAKELFGEDIDVSEITPLGKIIRMYAKGLSITYEDAENIYYSRFPNTAKGTSLDHCGVFAGITRNPATQAQYKIKVYSTPDTETETEIGIGELIVCGEDNEIVFYSANNYVIPPNGGYAEVIVECATAGITGNVSIINEIVNPIADIDHIEYVGIVKSGEDVENDSDFRKRFSAAIQGAGSGTVNAIRAAVLRVPTVTSAGIIVNDTDDKDEKGRPPRSFECYVYGGENYEQEIAEAIFDKAPLGIKTYGEIAKTVKDNGGYPHTIYFSHTEKVNIVIEIKYTKDNTFEDDGEAQIKKVISDYINGLGVGTSVILSSLYGKIYSVSGITDVTSIKIGANGETPTTENINIKEYQVAQIDEIVLTEETV